MSVLYNTGSICFDPDLFTINPAYLPGLLGLVPPQIGVPGQANYSPFPPGLLLQYCPECAFEHAGLSPARGLPVSPSSPPSLTEPISVTPSGPPVILVLKNGTKPLVSRYWLGKDWLIHYITVGGQQGAISLDQLNLNATGAINYGRGVVFSLPGWPAP